MKILSEKSFETRNHVRVTCRVDDKGEACLRFEGLYRIENSAATNGKDYPVFFHPEEREAMQTLLAGGKLEVKPKINKGDIVRFFPNRNAAPWYTHVAQPGSLAVVAQDCGGSDTYVEVRWICARSETQRDGEYQPEFFEVVTMDQLSDTDKQEIINRSLRG